jgi:hypothetical protein
MLRDLRQRAWIDPCEFLPCPGKAPLNVRVERRVEVRPPEMFLQLAYGALKDLPPALYPICPGHRHTQHSLLKYRSVVADQKNTSR